MDFTCSCHASALIVHTVPFSLPEVLAIGAVASLVLWVEELRKLVVRRRAGRGRGAASAANPYGANSTETSEGT